MGDNWNIMIIYVIGFVVLFYLFLILPRKRQDKKHADLLSSLQKGDKVVTIGGIKGRVSVVKDDSIVLRVGEENDVEFLKKAIAYKENEE
ncbi:MAG: preprotein translocase subunit YajC [Syntrophomonadaceae bacterium]|jgi:preprotein translocase subunit YajC|nr:preprotein translocase subunit YajC [Syntrophomonadaceae bacterium]